MPEDTSEELFTLRITIEKIRQNGRVEQEDKVSVESNNLSLKNVTDMRGELIPVLISFNQKDEV